MTVDERSRLQLAEALKRALGDEEGITLMELLPPVGWADIATKQDLGSLRQELVAFEGRMDARFAAIDTHFAAIDTRFAAIDARFESQEGRFGSLEGRFDAKLETLGHRLESRFDDLAREIRGQTWRLMTLMVAFVGVVVAAVRF